PVRDDTTIESGQFTYFRKIEGKMSEDFRTEAESPIEIPISRSRFTGMGLIAIDKKNLSGRGRALRAPIGVLLNAILDDTNHEMLVCVTSESMLHIMRMNGLYGIRTFETINPNPLRRLRHKNVSIDRPLRKVTTSRNVTAA